MSLVTSLVNMVSAKAPPKVMDENSHHSDSTEEALDLKGDQFTNKEEAKLLNLQSYDLIALGLTTAIGGHYFAWNAGLSAGFGSFLIALFLVSTAYYSVVLCIAELSSALPFAGGAYGVARVTLGIYPGFLVAVCDSFKSIIYVVNTVFSIGTILTFITKKEAHYEYAYWMGFYVFALAVHGWGGKFFWRFNLALAILSVLILFIFIFGSIPFAHFHEYAQLDAPKGHQEYFHGGIEEFVRVLPLASRFFVGIQSINLACGQIQNPKKEVPRAYIGSMTFVMFTSFAVLFLCSSLKPGVHYLMARPRPFTTGFKIMFGIPRNRATALNLPATVMSGFGFMYYYGQQLSAMGKSGLINPIFGYETPGHNSPIVALVVGSVIGYGLCVLIYHKPDTANQLYALSVLGATTTYLSIFASFVLFRWYFPSIKREFTNPLGIYGAVYGFLVFLLVFISVSALQEDQVAIIVFACIIAASSVYYYFVVRKRQVFSEEEKTVMFKAYLVMNNAAKADRIKRGAAARTNLNRLDVGGSVSNTNTGTFGSNAQTPVSGYNQNQPRSIDPMIPMGRGGNGKSDEIRTARIAGGGGGGTSMRFKANTVCPTPSYDVEMAGSSSVSLSVPVSPRGQDQVQAREEEQGQGLEKSQVPPTEEPSPLLASESGADAERETKKSAEEKELKYDEQKGVEIVERNKINTARSTDEEQGSTKK